MLGLRQRTSCREKRKELQILTVLSLYSLELMTSVTKNPDEFQTNSSIHNKDTRQENQLYSHSVRLTWIKKGVHNSSIRIFNKLPPQTAQIRDDTDAFRNIFKRFLIKRAFI